MYIVQNVVFDDMDTNIQRVSILSFHLMLIE